MPTKKVARKKPEEPDVPANAETDVEASGSMGLLLALLKAAGITLTTQQAAALTASDTQHKTDVNVPELMTGLNGLVMSNAVTHAKNVDAINLNALKDNQEANAVNSQRRGDHRDQNHDRQININEDTAFSVLSIAAAYERLRNPTPEK
jgi:hypothetical protein